MLGGKIKKKNKEKERKMTPADARLNKFVFDKP